MDNGVVRKSKTNFHKITHDKKRILVTGGAGFIGSNLIKKLLNNGCRVICMDNFFSSRKENISKFMDNKNFKFIKHDVINPFAIEVDEIYNLACPAREKLNWEPLTSVEEGLKQTIGYLRDYSG
ncbi:MAG: GDP-mannose 4,6-dehydratase [Halanaerobiales bacterium]